MVIACFWRDMGFVAYTRFCRESGFVVNTRFFGFVLSRLLLRHKGFYSDFVQISAQKIGGWDLCLDEGAQEAAARRRLAVRQEQLAREEASAYFAA